MSLNFEQVAIDAARQQRDRLLARAKPTTHVSAPRVRSYVRGQEPTLWGRHADPSDIDCEHPTCGECQQRKAE